MRADFLALLTRPELHLSHGSYRSQSLPTKPHGVEVKQVVGLTYLGRGVALKGEARIGL